MAQIVDIKNYSLTTSFTEVTVDSDLKFTQYTAVTEDGSNFQVRTASSGSVLFPISKDLGTMPLQVDKNRLYESDSTTLFYAKGSSGANLCVIFWRD